MADKNLLDAIARGVVVFDGAMGTTLQRMQLEGSLTVKDFDGRQGCNEVLSLTRPDIVSGVHRGYLEVGCDAVETNTFGASRPKLDEFDLGAKVHEVNETAARIARAEADKAEKADGRPASSPARWARAGSFPSSSDPDLGRVRPAELIEIFREQTQGLLKGGVDCVIAETAQDLLELRAQIFGARKAMQDAGRSVPVIAQITLDPSGRMLLGSEPLAAAALLTAAGVDVMGLNCSTGPREMVDPLRALSEGAPLPLSCQPNAGIPENRDGVAVYPLKPPELAEYLARFVRDFRLSIVGGCCGTTPEHLKQVIEAVRGAAPARKPPRRAPMLSSGLKAVALRQEPRPLVIGERVNSQGSRKMKELLLANDLHGILAVAREQVEGGAHALDVCVALTERADEQDQMVRTVARLVGTDRGAALHRLDRAGGGRRGARVAAGRRHRELGQPRARARKDRPDVPALEAVRRLHRRDDHRREGHGADARAQARGRAADLRAGLEGWPAALAAALRRPHLHSRDRRRAVQAQRARTIEGIALVKEKLPGVLTVLGVCNVCFGLSKAARPILNSVFLYALPSRPGSTWRSSTRRDPALGTRSRPTSASWRRIWCFDRRADALARLIEHFEAKGPRRGQGRDRRKIFDTPEARIHHQIVDRQQKGLIETLDEALKTHTAVEVLNDVLLRRDEGRRRPLRRGRADPAVRAAVAEVMKRAVAHLEQFLDKQEGYAKRQGGARHRLRRRPRHRQEPRQDDPLQQRLHRHDLGKQVPVNRIVDRRSR